MNIILFDNEVRDQLLPLTFTRPMCEIRVGILTIREKWEKWLNAKVSYITQDYLSEKFPIDYGEENLVINGAVLPSDQLCTLIDEMDFNEAYLKGDELIVAKLNEEQFEKLIHDEDIDEIKGIDIEDTEFIKINYPWDIFSHNAKAIQLDFELLTKGRSSQPISASNTVLGEGNIFIEEGAEIECSVLNTKEGPIYIGKNALIMEGSLIRGPFAMGDNAILKMATRIYGPTTLGPYSKVGGEVKNSVIQGFSNKSHDGFLGNSVIGEWCNIGADTNSSNLKNDYSEVKCWSYREEKFIKTGLQFCGLIMGDHSKTAINTMFNTGTTVGVCANVFGEGFPRNFIPSFSWGGKHGYKEYIIEKAFQAMERVTMRRNLSLSVEDRVILLRIFEDTAKYRKNY